MVVAGTDAANGWIAQAQLRNQENLATRSDNRQSVDRDAGRDWTRFPLNPWDSTAIE
jgi:hypothetical protein